MRVVGLHGRRSDRMGTLNPSLWHTHTFPNPPATWSAHDYLFSIGGNAEHESNHRVQ